MALTRPRVVSTGSVRLAFRAAWIALGFAAGYLWQPASAHLRATSLMLRVSDPDAPVTGLRSIGVVPVDERALDVTAGASGVIHARLYEPRGLPHAPGLVIVHGVHRLGIDEPRLVRFARAIAGEGVRVLTPEVRELVDYHVDPEAISTIGLAARALRQDVPADREVGVMGLSFAGGLALLAATDERFAGDVDFVVAVGAHDDLARVSRFFATNSIARPDGTLVSMRAHEYGPLVLVYSRVEDFFPAEDVPVAREAIRTWLWEEQDKARVIADKLSPESKALMDRLFDHHIDAITPQLLREVDRQKQVMAEVSPHGRLSQVHCPVFLLHGAGDNVIPPCETEWLAHDLPPVALRRELVSPAISHVELGADPSWVDRWAVVDFMAEVLEQAERGRRM